MIFAVVVTLAVLAMASAEYVRMEPSVNQFSSSRWLQEKIPSEDSKLTAIFVLKHDKNSVEKFERNLLEISTPSNPRYGNWLKPEEVLEMLNPSKDALKMVTEYVASFGVPAENVRVSKFLDKVHVTMPVKTANEMFRTEFAQFRSVQERGLVLPRVTKPYYLPEEVAKVVSFVADILRFPSIRDSPKSYGAEVGETGDSEFQSCGTKCSGFTTPDVLQSAYGFTDIKTVASGNSVAVAEFQYQYYDQADINAFDNACDVTVSVDETIGGNKEAICQSGGCVEALLDIEYIGAIVNPIPLTVIYSSTYSLLDWVDSVISMANPPLVHSVSYGNDEVQQTSTEYMESCNTQFMIAGSMGLSILFASGDQGVWG